MLRNTKAYGKIAVPLDALLVPSNVRIYFYQNTDKMNGSAIHIKDTYVVELRDLFAVTKQQPAQNLVGEQVVVTVHALPVVLRQKNLPRLELG